MEPRLALSHLSSPGAVPCSPPLCVIEQALYKSGNMIQEDLAKKILIPISEVDIWLNHLRTASVNRRRGAAKAATTKNSKQMAGKQQEENV